MDSALGLPTLAAVYGHNVAYLGANLEPQLGHNIGQQVSRWCAFVASASRGVGNPRVIGKVEDKAEVEFVRQGE